VKLTFRLHLVTRVIIRGSKPHLTLSIRDFVLNQGQGILYPSISSSPPPRPPGHVFISGPGSSVGIATGYGLDGTRIESRWGRDFPSVQTDPEGHPASCTMGTASFLGVKCCRGVTLTPLLLPVPWSRKCRAIPPLPLWAVRPVQSFSACTSVHFTFTFTFTCLYCMESKQISSSMHIFTSYALN